VETVANVLAIGLGSSAAAVALVYSLKLHKCGIVLVLITIQVTCYECLFSRKARFVRKT
jgi:hypothetical protein